MTKTEISWRAGIACVLVAATGAAQAQATPDAGSLLQQIERDRQTAPKRLPKPEAATVPQEMKAAPGLVVTVTQFLFAGNKLLADDQLAAVVGKFVGRPLGFAELQKAAIAVAERYRQSGWVVRAFLPKQEIEGGIVTIQIVEGRFGSVRLDGGEPQRFGLPAARRYVEAQQAHGEPVNAAAIDRAVMLLDDLPGIAATSTFSAGKEEGETDLVLKLADTPPFLGNVDADNTGTRSTGANKISANLYLDSPAGFGDQLAINLIKSEGSEYGRIGLTAPVGYGGLRAGINATRLVYRVITPESAALGIRGTADTAGLEGNYPIIRARSANLSIAATLDRKSFDNWTDIASTSRYRIDVGTLTLSGNAFDGFGGNGVSSASLAYSGGNVDLSGSANQAADAGSTQTAGGYSKLKLTASRNQSITGDFSLYGQYAIQSASRNLDSSEKLILGGASGVRAYPGGEGTGSEGQTLTLEARLRLSAGLGLTAFYDWGRITAVNRNNTSPAGGALAALNAYSLSGYGLNLTWLTPIGAQLKATWAHREGANPNPTASGLDQDGSATLNRFWLSASMPF